MKKSSQEPISSEDTIMHTKKLLTQSNQKADRCQTTEADRVRVAKGRQTLLSDKTYFEAAEIFRALSDPSRAKIIYCLLQQELCTCDLAAITNLSESSVSQHLRILRQLRLVKNRRNGKQVFYSLDDMHIRILLLVCLNHIRDGEDQHADLDQILALVEASSTR